MKRKIGLLEMRVVSAAMACALFCGETLHAQVPAVQAPNQPPPALPSSPVGPAVANVPAFREVKDEMGRSVRIPQAVGRIVSLAPSLTETIYALGLQDHLVGDTAQCDYPPEAKKISKVGGVTNPSIEEVAALHPDLVLVAAVNRFETVRALDDLNIPVYETDPHNIEEIIASTTKLADVLGAPQAGMSVAADLQQRLADLHSRLADQTARRVLFVVWTDPLISIGKNTFIADALNKAGAISIVEATQDWPHLSLEEAVRLQPEFLIFTAENDEKAPDPAILSSLPGWRSLEAVKNHRFVVVSDAVDRPAPRIISAIEEMAHQLHADAFAPPTPPPANQDNPKKDAPTPEKNSPPGSKVPVSLQSVVSPKNQNRTAACNR